MFTLFFRVNGFFMPFGVFMFLEFQVIVFVNPYPVSFTILIDIKEKTISNNVYHVECTDTT